MDLINALKIENNNTTTENGAFAYTSTLNYNLDFFNNISSFRENQSACLKAFKKAFEEDKLLALKNLFYMRNIRGLGQGEREASRTIYKWLAKNYPTLMSLNIELIGEYGRIDDYYALLDTQLEDKAFELLKNQIDKDLVSEHPSLTAKWLKSCNTSSKISRRMGQITAKHFGMKEKEYRKMLTALRKKIDVTEVKMCDNKFDSIIYENVPSKAMLNYTSAFESHDSKRFDEYINQVLKNKAKINSSTLYPYEIISKYNLKYGNSFYEPYNYNLALESQWNALPNYVTDSSSTLVVADTSGSMKGKPLNVALSLAIYFARLNKGVWNDKMITFSSKPHFIDFVGCKSLYDCLGKIPCINENTNIEKVFDLVLNAAINNHVPVENMVKNIIIISDMQFDKFDKKRKNKISFTDYIKEKYEKAGYKMPSLIYWNVCERTIPTVHALSNDNSVKLISGFSQSAFDSIIKSQAIDPETTMLDILNSKLFDKVRV